MTEAVATDTTEKKTVAETKPGTLTAAWLQYPYAYDAGGEAQYMSSRTKVMPESKGTWGHPGYGSPE